MKNVCEYCQKDYEAKRATSKYCGDKCKMAAYRNAKPDVTVTDVTVTQDQSVTVPDLDDPQYLQDIVDGKDNPNTTQPVTLSDGQQFHPDPRPQQVLDGWYRGHGTPYQQQLATLSLQYDILKGSDRARQHAETLLKGGAWS